MIKNLLLFILVLSSGLAGYVAPLYADWAHHHVVWINCFEQTE